MRRVGCLPCSESTLRRRDFLRVGGLSLLGIHLSQFLKLRSVMAASDGARSKTKAEACILLWLEGGPSHVDTWDPKSNSSFRPIATSVPGIQISELLPRVAEQMNKFSIIRSIHTEEDNHPQGTYSDYALDTELWPWVQSGWRDRPERDQPITRRLFSLAAISKGVTVTVLAFCGFAFCPSSPSIK